MAKKVYRRFVITEVIADADKPHPLIRHRYGTTVSIGNPENLLNGGGEFTAALAQLFLNQQVEVTSVIVTTHRKGGDPARIEVEEYFIKDEGAHIPDEPSRPHVNTQPHPNYL